PPKDPATGKRPLPNRRASDDRDGDTPVIRRLTATNARLAVIPREEGKNARVWDIFELDFHDLGSGEPATFTAALINPIPYGKIHARGRFGPWQSNEPGASALTGDYTFAADLGSIKGLDGELSASGSMSGTLEQISTTGTTHTPDFRLTELDGASLPLQTSYDAIVDGTKGDVELKRVDVVLGKSKLTTSGRVEGTQGLRGKRIEVAVKSDAADLGELLQFVSKAGSPPASGNVVIDARLELPQGTSAVLDRVEVTGTVRAERVRFASDAVQEKIDELSRRGQGRPTDESIEEVASRMATAFTLRKGVFTYRGLSFNVQGANIRLDGTHSLKTKSVDLTGVVLLNVTVSETQTGFKSWLLKPFDPLFRRRGAGTRLSIKIAGTQDAPKVGLELGRTLRGR
ncbi:MAG TPA: AsmA-like C-terminal region-containing protein, partial [Vicinamibacterales bacterium]|nr:AsmA-like C-terminal region-containing protein [Vicinamibacterales bacterium]